MKAIFYDLETSDKNFIGQILNYSFILVDEKLQIESELNGIVRISNLQLPSARAILANRINVLEHQSSATDSEAQAMKRIYEFIGEIVAKEKSKVVLIGYNSSRFDLPYLRTSFIRNGFNPYFAGRLVYRDMLFASKKLSCTRSDFPRGCKPGAEGEDRNVLSLSLESLTKQLGLLEGKQAHSSREDVILTIDLARCLRERFNFDVCAYEAYEVASLHRQAKESIVAWALWPNYDLSSGSVLASCSPLCLLDFDNKQGLWIDLLRYKDGKGKQAISYMNQNSTQFIFAGLVNKDSPIKAQVDATKLPAYEEIMQLAQAARKEFANVRVTNFWERSTCDIEQDIYRLGLNGTDCVIKAIQEPESRNEAQEKNKDANILVLRHRLALFDPCRFVKQKNGMSMNEQSPCQKAEGKDSPQLRSFENMLKKYALYRYGGKLQLSKSLEVAGTEPKPLSETHHLSLKDMLQEIDEILKNANAEDKVLMEALKNFYLESYIYRCASEELLSSSEVENKSESQAVISAVMA